MLRWYLIRSKVFREAIAQENLHRQGYDVYLPCAHALVRRHGSWIERPGPLFPRYLFLRLHVGHQSLAQVESTKGVAGVVRFGSRYAVVPDGVVSCLRERTDPATGMVRITARQGFLAGEPVRVTSGPFDGLEGVFERMEGAERVVILLSLLGRESEVEVPAYCVAAGQAV
jgi:transcriptional antiterminator RfaH